MYNYTLYCISFAINVLVKVGNRTFESENSTRTHANWDVWDAAGRPGLQRGSDPGIHRFMGCATKQPSVLGCIQHLIR